MRMLSIMSCLRAQWPRTTRSRCCARSPASWPLGAHRGRACAGAEPPHGGRRAADPAVCAGRAERRARAGAAPEGAARNRLAMEQACQPPRPFARSSLWCMSPPAADRAPAGSGTLQSWAACVPHVRWSRPSPVAKPCASLGGCARRRSRRPLSGWPRSRRTSSWALTSRPPRQATMRA